MERLRLKSLNVWLGDGHFRNTLHFDPHDNFLCQTKGSKLVLLWEPSQADNLYYADRLDVQAKFSARRGEYDRRETDIVSSNTASVNMAAPDLAAFPKLADALKAVRAVTVAAGDCLYLPRRWHHHVFTEADPDEGFNAAVNIWIDREKTLQEHHEVDGGAAPRVPRWPPDLCRRARARSAAARRRRSNWCRIQSTGCATMSSDALLASRGVRCAYCRVSTGHHDITGRSTPAAVGERDRGALSALASARSACAPPPSCTWPKMRLPRRHAAWRARQRRPIEHRRLERQATRGAQLGDEAAEGASSSNDAKKRSERASSAWSSCSASTRYARTATLRQLDAGSRVRRRGGTASARAALSPRACRRA